MATKFWQIQAFGFTGSRIRLLDPHPGCPWSGIPWLMCCGPDQQEVGELVSALSDLSVNRLRQGGTCQIFFSDSVVFTVLFFWFCWFCRSSCHLCWIKTVPCAGGQIWWAFPDKGGWCEGPVVKPYQNVSKFQKCWSQVDPGKFPGIRFFSGRTPGTPDFSLSGAIGENCAQTCAGLPQMKKPIRSILMQKALQAELIRAAGRSQALQFPEHRISTSGWSSGNPKTQCCKVTLVWIPECCGTFTPYLGIFWHNYLELVDLCKPYSSSRLFVCFYIMFIHFLSSLQAVWWNLPGVLYVGARCQSS